MNKLNKFLIIFSAVFMLFSFAIWTFVQSTYVSTLLSEYINTNIIADKNIKISFSRIEAGFFPPKTVISNVRVNFEDNIDIEMKEMSAAFSVWSMFSSNLSFNTIELRDGYLSIKKLPEEETKNDDTNIFKVLKLAQQSLPFQVNQIELVKTDVLIEEKISIPVEYLSVKPYETSFDVLLSTSAVNYDDLFLDNLFVDLELEEDRIRVRSSSIGVKDSLFQFKGKYQSIKKVISGSANYRINVDNFEDSLKNRGVNLRGIAEGKLTVAGSLKNESFIIKNESSITNLESDYVIGDKIDINFKYNNEHIVVDKLLFERRGGKLKLLNNLKMSSKDFSFVVPPQVETKRLRLNDILYFLGDDLKVLKGYVSGILDLKMDSDYNLSIDSIKKNKLQIENLALVVTKNEILNVKHVAIDKFNLNVKSGVDMDITSRVNDSNLHVVGSIVNGDINFKANANDLQIKDIGGIVGEVAQGRGDLDIEVVGNEIIMLTADVKKLESLKVFDYHFGGESNGKITYNITTDKLSILDLKNKEKGDLLVNGDIDIDKSTLDVHIKVDSLSTNEIKQILVPLEKIISPYVDPLLGRVSGDVILSGNFSNIITSANLNANRLTLYREPLDRANISFVVDDKEIVIKKAGLYKNKSNVEGSFLYNYKKGFDKVRLKSTRIKMNDLHSYREVGIGYNGYITFMANVNNNNGYSGNAVVELSKTKIGNEEVGASELDLQFGGNRIKYKMNLFENMLRSNGFIDLVKDGYILNSGYVVKVDDVKAFFSALSEHNSFNNELEGEVLLDGNIMFDSRNIRKLDYRLDIEKFYLSNHQRKLRLSKSSGINIVNSKLQRFDINLLGSGGKLEVTGTGDLLNEFTLTQSLDIDLNYAILFSEQIERIRGKINGEGFVKGNINTIDISHDFYISHFGLKIKDVPLEISGASGEGVLEEKKIKLKRFAGEIGTGKFSTTGYVFLKFPYPEINLLTEYQNINYQIETRSTVNSDGRVSLVGDKIPYFVRGKVYIDGGLVENEFNEFKSSSGYNKSLSKYIENTKQGLPDLINLDIDLSVKETIRIRNRLSDLLVTGDVKATGEFNSPDLEGQLIIVPGLSKFKFRGNDFNLSEGVVYLSKDEASEPITLNLVANSTIGQYDIEMGISGSVDDVSINLESNPYLTRDNIFSLLTLGVTSDFSQSLEDSQRTNLTTIGIGTFLVDQLNINEGLDSTLGLKLSVLPEISESSDSPIEEATKSEQNVKTATKVQITKKVNDNIDLKFSNTFDSDNNKQSINVDYNIDDKLSIEGIFESEEDVNNKKGTDGSAGADLKYKWSF